MYEPPKTSVWTRFIAIVLVIVISFGIGFAAGKNGVANNTLDFTSLFAGDNVDFTLVEEVWQLINTKYVGANDFDRRAVIFGAVRGMLSGLNDPYTVFFDQAQTDEFLQGLSGSFEGVGIEIAIRDEALVVVAPLKNSPAQHAGIRAGDRIVAIDGDSTGGILVEEAVSKIRGPKGTAVVLSIVHEGSSDTVDIRVVRDTIEIPSVELEIVDGHIAYITINQFGDTTTDEFSRAAQQVLQSDADRVVVDVRNNPGGFLDSAVAIAGWLMEPGNAVVIEEEGDGTRTSLRTSGNAALADMPLVVVQNSGSASASEILAGALRDVRSAPIVGEQSFGKGTVQTIEDLQGNTTIKLTIARWLTPSGQQINGTGIAPTVEVAAADDGSDPQRQRALEIVAELPR
jgi:carboxyl-terminal processing protease